MNTQKRHAEPMKKHVPIMTYKGMEIADGVAACGRSTVPVIQLSFAGGVIGQWEYTSNETGHRMRNQTDAIHAAQRRADLLADWRN